MFGKSSGGYGALIMGMRHADLFGAIACHSGDMDFDLCYRPDFPKAASAIDRAGGLEAWFRAFESQEKKERRRLSTLINIVAMAACYSPGAAAPLGLDLPFDLYTCALREDVWAAGWPGTRAHGSRYTDALRSLRLLFIDCGVRDEYNLQYGARLLTAVLREHDIAYEYEEFDDDHRNIAYRYDVSLPRLAAACTAKRSGRAGGLTQERGPGAGRKPSELQGRARFAIGGGPAPRRSCGRP